MLSLNSNIILRSEPQYYGTYAAFDYIKAQTTLLSPEEFKILSYLADKNANVEEIALENKIGLKKCVKLIKKLEQNGFISENNGKPRNIDSKRNIVDRELFSKFPVPFLSSPSTVDLFITSRCNLNCIHCFASIEQQKEMPLEEVSDVLDQLEKAGVLEVRINGGEPFTHSDISRILKALETKRFRKVLLTNGTLLTEAFIKQMKKAMVTPTISLDDSEASVHDEFRGQNGAFQKTLSGIKILKEHNIHFGINCCLHAKNLNKIKQLITLAEDAGAQRIAFLDLKSCGRLKGNQKWIPSKKEYERAFLTLLMEKMINTRIDVSTDAFMNCPVLSEMKEEAKRGYVTCEAGRTRLSISSDGSIYPCNTVLGDSKWNMGNLKKEKLVDIWFSDKWAFFRGANKIKDLHHCRECKYLKKCREFYCRLIPYNETGDALSSSSTCQKNIES